MIGGALRRAGGGGGRHLGRQSGGRAAAGEGAPRRCSALCWGRAARFSPLGRLLCTGEARCIAGGWLEDGGWRLPQRPPGVGGCGPAALTGAEGGSGGFRGVWGRPPGGLCPGGGRWGSPERALCQRGAAP